MNLFSVVERIMIRLGTLPGLSFLGSYVNQFRGQQTIIKQKMERYQGYVSSVREAGGEVRQSIRGSSQETDDDEDDIEEEDDDFETFMQ